MVNILGATGSLLPVLLSRKTLADKPAASCRTRLLLAMAIARALSMPRLPDPSLGEWITEIP